MRSSNVQGLQILSEENLSDLARLARSEALTTGGSAEGGEIRIRSVGQIGQILAETGREIREQNLHDYQGLGCWS